MFLNLIDPDFSLGQWQYLKILGNHIDRIMIIKIKKINRLK